MATKGDIKAKARPVTVRTVRHEVPVTVVYRAADGVATPVDYSDMTAEQFRGIAGAYHVTAVICRTCGDEAPHCPDVSRFFS
jgi:hypothetical protein